MWGRKGWVTIQGLGKIDNIGAYVTAYLTDIPVGDDVVGKDIIVKEVDGVKRNLKKVDDYIYIQKACDFIVKVEGLNILKGKNVHV